MSHLTNYAERLAAFTGTEAPTSEAKVVLDTLVERHALSIAMASAPLNADDTAKLVELDAKLRSSAAICVAIASPAGFQAWRDSVQPHAQAWWWFLDQVAEAGAPKPSPLIALGAGAMFTAALSLAAEISNRFLTDGPDFFGVFGTLVQGAMALVAGSAFTKVGREWLTAWSGRLGVPARRQEAWMFWLALALLVAVIALRLSLPFLATRYNNAGVRMQGSGQISNAIDSFKRALSLNPDFAEARYNLATAYEDVLEWDKATGEYQRAIQADSAFHPAYNNLARLYLLRRNDPATALGLVGKGLATGAASPETRYSLLKNRGWAHLGLRALAQAEDDLMEAIRLLPERGDAHCLLALTREERRLPAGAQWRDCLAYASNGSVEPQWRAAAVEKLSQGEKRP